MTHPGAGLSVHQPDIMSWIASDWLDHIMQIILRSNYSGIVGFYYLDPTPQGEDNVGIR